MAPEGGLDPFQGTFALQKLMVTKRVAKDSKTGARKGTGVDSPPPLRHWTPTRKGVSSL